mmetsp:Transcript_104754/g.327847  ORF Transcript_104754/g.327847 Transcript_104754/m.327847 type:complete len:388 (-) Transcript_104754:220-1383(-)
MRGLGAASPPGSVLPGQADAVARVGDEHGAPQHRDHRAAEAPHLGGHGGHGRGFLLLVCSQRLIQYCQQAGFGPLPACVDRVGGAARHGRRVFCDRLGQRPGREPLQVHGARFSVEALARGRLPRGGQRPDLRRLLLGIRLLHARREDQRAGLDGAGELPGHGIHAAPGAGPGAAPHHARGRARQCRRAVLHLGGFPRGAGVHHRLCRPGHLLEAAHDGRAEHVAAERLCHGLPAGADLHSARRRRLRRPGAARGRPGAGLGRPGPPAGLAPRLHGAGLLRLQRHRLRAPRQAGRGVARGGEPGQADLCHRLQRPRLQHAADCARGRRVHGRDPRLGPLLLRQDLAGPEPSAVDVAVCTCRHVGGAHLPATTSAVISPMRSCCFARC